MESSYREGGLYFFLSDLHWSQEWSEWGPKSLKSWKSVIPVEQLEIVKRLDPWGPTQFLCHTWRSWAGLFVNVTLYFSLCFFFRDWYKKNIMLLFSAVKVFFMKPFSRWYSLADLLFIPRVKDIEDIGMQGQWYSSIRSQLPSPWHYSNFLMWIGRQHCSCS